jgi:hypothetical protein
MTLTAKALAAATFLFMTRGTALAQTQVWITPGLGVSHALGPIGSTTTFSGQAQDVRLRNAPLLSALIQLRVTSKLRFALDGAWAPHGDVQGIFPGVGQHYLAAKVQTSTVTGGITFEALRLASVGVRLAAGFGFRQYDFSEVYHDQSGPWIDGTYSALSTGVTIDLPRRISIGARDVMLRATVSNPSHSTQHNLLMTVGRVIPF